MPKYPRAFNPSFGWENKYEPAKAYSDIEFNMHSIASILKEDGRQNVMFKSSRQNGYGRWNNLPAVCALLTKLI